MKVKDFLDNSFFVDIELYNKDTIIIASATSDYDSLKKYEDYDVLEISAYAKKNVDKYEIVDAILTLVVE